MRIMLDNGITVENQDQTIGVTIPDAGQLVLDQDQARRMSNALLSAADDLAAGPEPEDAWTTQDMTTCDLCEHMYARSEKQKLIFVGADRARETDSVCPACMERLGFSPVVVVPKAQYDRMTVDYQTALTKSKSMREVTR